MRSASPAFALWLEVATLLAISANAADDLRFVVVRLDGTHMAAGPFLSNEERAEAKHVWAWTSDLPPRKFEREEVPQDRKAIIGALRTPPFRSVVVRVLGWSRPEDLESLRVLAAPAEMWADVPEPLLPAYPVSRDGSVKIPVRDPVQIRPAGVGIGGTWEVIPRRADLVNVRVRSPATDLELRAETPEGTPADRILALAMRRPQGEAASRVVARFTSADGSLRIPALPALEVITLFLMTNGSAPLTISGTAADLSRTLRLPKAATVRGVFVDEEGRRLKGVHVEAEGWVSSEAPAPSRAEATSDEEGRWEIGTLPGVNVVVQASAPKRSPFRTRVSLEEGDVDLGAIELSPAAVVVFTVSDAEEQPLSGVRIESSGGFRGRTGEKGTLRVELPPAAESTVTVGAPGFVEQKIHLTPPLVHEISVILESVFSVRGRVSHESGDPASGALVTVTTGAAYRDERVEPDGTFALDVPANEEFELTLEAPTSGSVRRRQPPGRSGEVRDLGTITLPAGLIARGRITDLAAAPIPGARIWAVRPSAGGVVTAWAGGRIVQATSDAGGEFEIHGLTSGPTLLRIDAPDFARAYREIVPGATPADLGLIVLAPGRTVTVRTAPDSSAVARVDLRGQWLDADMMTAPVIEGEANVHNVPQGEYLVTVVAGRAVLCERRVAVTEDRDAVVECPAPRKVSGRVIVDGVPAFGGTLTWLRPAPTDALVETTLSRMGAAQQRIYGLGGGIVAVPVGVDGTFETTALRPGQWQVGWRSADSSGTPDRSFTIPDVEDAEIVVEFSGSTIRGRVVDETGQPVPSARVREIGGPLFGLAAADGSFSISAVQPGLHRLQASLAGRSSAAVDIHVESGKPAPEIVLEIDDEEEDVLSVRVVGAGGEPKAGAFVFVELAGGIIKTITADASGIATATAPEGLPDVARVVAYADNAWAFGEIRPIAGAGQQTGVVRFGRTGGLRIRSGSESGTPVLLSPHVPGDLIWMLGRIGLFVSVFADSSFEIHGLPPGPYEVILGSQRVPAKVAAGTIETVEFR